MSLCIGIELEGVAVKRRASAEPFPTQTERQMRLISDALDEADLKSRIYLPSSTRGTGPDYTVWNVTIDATISETTSGSSIEEDKAFRTRFGFELVSPVFYKTDGDEWQNEVKSALKAIEKAVHWKANRSTGFHIHIGRGENMKFSLDEVKKIAIFSCRFEDALDEFHPVDRRIDNDNILSNRHNELLEGMNNSQVYEMIQKASSFREICSIVNYTTGDNTYDGYSDSRFFKVNFTSLQKHQTIEFRQHEGTTDPERVVRWSRTVLKIVDFAIRASFDMLMAPGETVEDMLKYIGPNQ